MKKVGICSGYFNPLTRAHVACFNNSRKFCDELYVIVNNDIQVKLKGSVPFQDENERQYIVRNIKSVTNALIAIDTSLTVEKTIASICAKFTRLDDIIFFINGGDRVSPSEKELEVCCEYDMITVYGVGGYDKVQSSSKLIEQAAKAWIAKQPTEYFSGLSNGAFNENI